MGFLRNRRNRIIEEKIKEAFKTPSELIDTNIHWEAFQKFAEEHDGKTDKHSDGGLDTAFNISLNTGGLFEGVDESFLATIYEAQEKDDSGLRPHFRTKPQDVIKKEKPWHDIFRVIGVRNRLDATTSIKVRRI